MTPEEAAAALDEVPVVAIEDAVRAGVRPTLSEWLALPAAVRHRWRIEAERAPVALVESLLRGVRGAADELAIRAALERVHASEVTDARRGAL